LVRPICYIYILMKITLSSYRDKDFGEVTLRRNPRAKRITIRMRPDGKVSITVPQRVPYDKGIAFLNLNREYVKQHIEKIKRRAVTPTASQSADREKEIFMVRMKAKQVLPPRVMELAGKYGFKVNRVTIKDNRSNWGSCSTKGNINLNLRLVLLPDHLRDSVILHELCHLRHMNHSVKFHALLDVLCRNELGRSERELVRELKTYRIS